MLSKKSTREEQSIEQSVKKFKSTLSTPSPTGILKELFYSLSSPSDKAASLRVLFLIYELGLRDLFTLFYAKSDFGISKKHPILRDGDLLLFESGAIFLYLLDHYSKKPSELQFTPTCKPFILDHLFFVAANLHPIYDILDDSNLRTRKELAAISDKWKSKILPYFEYYLSGNQFLCGNSFSGADIAVFGDLLVMQEVGMEFSDVLLKYMDRGKQRQSFKKLGNLLNILQSANEKVTDAKQHEQTRRFYLPPPQLLIPQNILNASADNLTFQSPLPKYPPITCQSFNTPIPNATQSELQLSLHEHRNTLDIILRKILGFPPSVSFPSQLCGDFTPNTKMISTRFPDHTQIDVFERGQLRFRLKCVMNNENGTTPALNAARDALTTSSEQYNVDFVWSEQNVGDAHSTTAPVSNLCQTFSTTIAQPDAERNTSELRPAPHLIDNLPQQSSNTLTTQQKLSSPTSMQLSANVKISTETHSATHWPLNTLPPINHYPNLSINNQIQNNQSIITTSQLQLSLLTKQTSIPAYKLIRTIKYNQKIFNFTISDIVTPNYSVESTESLSTGTKNVQKRPSVCLPRNVGVNFVVKYWNCVEFPEFEENIGDGMAKETTANVGITKEDINGSEFKKDRNEEVVGEQKINENGENRVVVEETQIQLKEFKEAIPSWKKCLIILKNTNEKLPVSCMKAAYFWGRGLEKVEDYKRVSEVWKDVRETWEIMHKVYRYYENNGMELFTAKFFIKKNTQSASSPTTTPTEDASNDQIDTAKLSEQRSWVSVAAAKSFLPSPPTNINEIIKNRIGDETFKKLFLYRKGSQEVEIQQPIAILKRYRSLVEEKKIDVLEEVEIILDECIM